MPSEPAEIGSAPVESETAIVLATGTRREIDHAETG
jgi:hypothetical protein